MRAYKIFSKVILLALSGIAYFDMKLLGMLAKEPEARFSVVDVLSHPWTQTYYLGTIRHLKPPTTAGAVSTKSVLSSIRETSMLAYLQQLFADEIEIDLEERGTYETDSTMATQFSTNNSTRLSTASNSTKPSNKVYRLFAYKFGYFIDPTETLQADEDSLETSPVTTAPNSSRPDRRVSFFSKFFGKK
jgi:serine/threonine protein kinase